MIKTLFRSRSYSEFPPETEFPDTDSISANWKWISVGVSGEWVGVWLSSTKAQVRISIEGRNVQKIRLSTIFHVLGTLYVLATCLCFQEKPASWMWSPWIHRNQVLQKLETKRRPCKSVSSAQCSVELHLQLLLQTQSQPRLYSLFIYFASSGVAHTMLKESTSYLIKGVRAILHYSDSNNRVLFLKQKCRIMTDLTSNRYCEHSSENVACHVWKCAVVWNRP